jgi:hypothetical protein
MIMTGTAAAIAIFTSCDKLPLDVGELLLLPLTVIPLDFEDSLVEVALVDGIETPGYKPQVGITFCSIDRSDGRYLTKKILVETSILGSPTNTPVVDVQDGYVNVPSDGLTVTVEDGMIHQANGTLFTFLRMPAHLLLMGHPCGKVYVKT